MPYESTIPSYIWYLPTIPDEVFHVPTLNLQLHICFVHIQAHGAVGVESIIRAKCALPNANVYSRHTDGREVGLENAQF